MHYLLLYIFVLSSKSVYILRKNGMLVSERQSLCALCMHAYYVGKTQKYGRFKSTCSFSILITFHLVLRPGCFSDLSVVTGAAILTQTACDFGSEVSLCLHRQWAPCPLLCCCLNRGESRLFSPGTKTRFSTPTHVHLQTRTHTG